MIAKKQIALMVQGIGLKPSPQQGLANKQQASMCVNLNCLHANIKPSKCQIPGVCLHQCEEAGQAIPGLQDFKMHTHMHVHTYMHAAQYSQQFMLCNTQRSNESNNEKIMPSRMNCAPESWPSTL